MSSQLNSLHRNPVSWAHSTQNLPLHTKWYATVLTTSAAVSGYYTLLVDNVCYH